jgi:hypothetical protein
MPSSLVDAVLLVALVLTTLRVGAMYRELRRLRSHHEDYRRIFAETGAALHSVERAIGDLNGEGREVLAALNERIAEARRLAGVLGGASVAAADPSPAASGFQRLALAPAHARA